jgi:hypothetical protein
MEDANKGITSACDRLDRVIRNQPGGVIGRYEEITKFFLSDHKS